MKKSLIPWHVFREALATQEPCALLSWLRRWEFMDEGVVLISPPISNQIPFDEPLAESPVEEL